MDGTRLKDDFNSAQTLIMTNDTVFSKTPSQQQTVLLTKKRVSSIQFYIIIGLLVLSIGGTVFWFSGGNNFFTAKSETENSPAITNAPSKQDEQLRSEVASLARNLADAGQKMLLLTWKAIYDPDFSANDLAVYDKDMYSIYSEIAKSQVSIKVSDKSTYDKIMPLVQEFQKIDTEITQAGIAFRQSKKRDLSKWQELYDQSSKFSGRLMNEMPGITAVKNP